MPKHLITFCYQGQTLTFTEAAALTGLPRALLWSRHFRGWSVQDMLERPAGWSPRGGKGGRRRPGDDIGSAIAAYLAAHPTEAQHLAEKYGWTDV